MRSTTAPRPKPNANRNRMGLATLVVTDDQMTLRHTRYWRRVTASEWRAMRRLLPSLLPCGARSGANTSSRLAWRCQ